MTSGLGLAGGCFEPDTHIAANDTCSALGARLCTSAEIQNNGIARVGCSIDQGIQVWSSTSCGPAPTTKPSMTPTESTAEPTVEPTAQPTRVPTTRRPTFAPSVQPTILPTEQPTVQFCGQGDVSFVKKNSYIDAVSNTVILVFEADMYAFNSLDISAGACGRLNGTVGVWTSVMLYDMCAHFTLTAPLQEVVSLCGFYSNLTDPALTKLTSYFTVLTSGTSYMNNIQIPQIMERSMTVQLDLKNTVSLESSVLSVFGTVLSSAIVHSLKFDIESNTLTIQLLVAASYPYDFYSLAVSNAAGWNAASANISNVMPTTLASFSCTTIYGPCYQLITITVMPSTSCSEVDVLRLNREWVIDLNVECNPLFSSEVSCATLNTTAPSISFKTTSDNMCAQLFATQSLTGTMIAYDTVNMTRAQSKFVIGAVTYFDVDVHSLVQLKSISIDSAYITDGYPVTFANPSVLPIYSGLNGNVNYFGYDNSAAVSVLNNISTLVSTNMKCRLQVQWMYGVTSASTGQLPMDTTVRAVIRVVYNTPSGGEGRRLLQVQSDRATAGNVVAPSTTAVGATVSVAALDTKATYNHNNLLWIILPVLVLGSTSFFCWRRKQQKDHEKSNRIY